MGRNQGCILTAALLSGQILLVSFAQAGDLPRIETRVIGDLGGEPIGVYLPERSIHFDPAGQVLRKKRSRKFVHAHFPVRTRSMRVGAVSREEAGNVPYDMSSSPLFIIGYDPVSIRWLRSNRQLLREKKAIGLVVNVETSEQMEELQGIAGSGVMMQPIPGDRLARTLGIKHYPFYMDNHGVMR